MKKHIFLIEASKDDMSAFLEVLDKVNICYKCTWAQNCEQALGQLAYLSPDIIFLDMESSGMNGIDCLAALKKLCRLRDIPVIIKSPVKNNTVEAQAKALGAVYFLVKPVTPALLEDIFNRLGCHADIPDGKSVQHR